MKNRSVGQISPGTAKMPTLAQSSDRPKLKRFRGSLDPIKGNSLTGWAIDTHHPEQRLRVEIQVEGKAPFEVLADQYKSKLAVLFETSGHHCFRVPVKELDRIRGNLITARVAGTDFYLKNSPIVVEPDHVVGLPCDAEVPYFHLAGEDQGAGTAIAFNANAQGNGRSSTLLFVVDPRTDAAGSLLDELARAGDELAACSSKNLRLVRYTSQPLTSAATLVSMIRAPDKKVLESYNNFLFIDPEDELPFAVRACSACSRLIVLLTPGAALPKHARDSVDVLIVPDDLDVPFGQFRRVIRYGALPGSTYSQVQAVKRAIKESLPRQVNAFFQVYGARSRYELPWTLSEVHDCVIVAEPGNWHDPAIFSFGDYVEQFARRVRALYTSEEFYLRYRTLIDQLNDDFDALPALISYALEDGNKIDVRS